MIPGFGEEAQEKLKNSSALITRAGGLGGTVAFYLAAAGIGKMVIAHGGNLTLSNLNRQILMTHDWVGKPRAEKIRETLLRFNGDLELEVLAENVTPDKAESWVKKVDIVCDCPPTFEERFALNEAIVRSRKPMIEAAMHSMEAHLTVIVPGQTPCLRCLYPEQPSWWEPLGFPVLGAVPGALGCLAAIEAIKVLTDFGEPLTGVLLQVDTLKQEYRKFRIRRDPQCPVCGHLQGGG